MKSLSIRHSLMLPLLIGALAISACEGSYIRNKIDEMAGKKTAVTPPAPPPAAPAPPAPPQPPAPPAPPTESRATTEAAPPPTNAGDQGASDAALIEEVNRYTACLNRTATRTADSRARYLSWVNEKTGPTCKETYISYGLYTLYEDGVKTCNEAAQKGKEGGPSLPKLEQPAAEVAAAYAELVPLTQKAYDYYEQQDYKDDNCVKAKEMHTQLLAAFNRYLSAEKQLSAELDAIKADLDVKELAQIEQQHGKKLEWYTKSFMIDARGLIRAMPKDNAGELNKDAYLSSFDALQKDYDGLTQYSAANAAEASGAFWYSAFENSAKNFFTKAKFVKRDLADGKKADNRSLNELIDSFNRTVDDANNIRFKFP